MIVYRIEGRSGVGPYRRLDECDNDLARRLVNHGMHHSKTYKPSPLNDGIRGFSSAYHFCGFKSVDQLKKWFHGARTGLRRCGFKMVTYEVPAWYVLVGNQQIVFERDYAVKISESPVP